MALTRQQIEADLALAEKASKESEIGASFDYTKRARTALPLYAKALMEAMRIIDLYAPNHTAFCQCEMCRFVAAYHAQEKT